MSSHAPASRRAPSIFLLIALFLVLSATALYAAEAPASSGSGQPAASAEPATPGPVIAIPMTGAAPLALARSRATLHRPGALVPLYATFAVLQGLDAHSTLTAINRGATEANPLLGGLASNSGALLAVKMGAAAGTIFVAEKLWKRNPAAAIVLMVGLNSAYAMIVAHNYQLGNR
ncbi:MAG: hypothetical protein KGN76_18000 [Acidobacteriota bacterium]|nr:hypothetical protein [Acidobacteriota bacterium]